MPIQSAARAWEAWWEEFEAMWEFGGLWVPVWHPFLSGRLARWRHTHAMIGRMLAKGQVWFAPMREIAAHVTGCMSDGTWTPRAQPARSLPSQAREGAFVILELFGYDRNGEVRELDTTLQKNALRTRDVALAAMGFNAPAWIAAVSMSVLYSVVGAAAPLAILISFLFPMLVLALCLVYLTRQAPSAGGIFTFCSRFVHPAAGTILGWAYTISCAAIVPMTAIIGTQYLQALIPGLKGPFAAKVIGTLVTLAFMLVCLRGVLLTARLTTVFLVCEVTVIVGLGMCGIVSPHVAVPLRSLYALPKDWTVLGSGVLLGMWMLANFDSAINYIEEAHVPVRTVQRALLIVLTSVFIIYSHCRHWMAVCNSRRDFGANHRER